MGWIEEFKATEKKYDDVAHERMSALLSCMHVLAGDSVTNDHIERAIGHARRASSYDREMIALSDELSKIVESRKANPLPATNEATEAVKTLVQSQTEAVQTMKAAPGKGLSR